MDTQQFSPTKSAFLCSVSHFTNLSTSDISIDFIEAHQPSSSINSLQQSSIFITYTLSVLVEAYHFNSSLDAWKYMNESLTVAVYEGSFTSYLQSTPSTVSQPDVYSDWIDVYTTVVSSEAPSMRPVVASSSGLNYSFASDPLKLLWVYILSAFFFVLLVLLCGVMYCRRLMNLRNPKQRALDDLGAQGGEIVPMEEDYVVWGLEGMVSKVSSKPVHPVGAESGDGDDDDVFKSYTLEMNRRKRSDFFIL